MLKTDKSTSRDQHRARRPALVDEALIALRRIFRATDLSAKTLARETGLTVPQLLILQMLERVGVATATEIAAEINLTQATITTILNRMDERGLIDRERDSKDRRKILITITRTGRTTLHKAPAALQERFLERFANLSDWEQSFIVAALHRVSHLMDAAEIDAAPLLDFGTFEQPPGDGNNGQD